MPDLSGKFALVTGSSRGIGRGIALELARAGAHVAVHYRREREAAEQTAAEIESFGRRTVVVGADVSRWEEVQAMAAQVLQSFGRLDIVVANSGIASRPAPVWEMDLDHWHKVIAVDLHGAFYTCRATVGELVRQRSGSVILVSSIGADLCAPFGAPYYAAKAAVNALTKTLARECAPAGVRVNALAPGLIHSDMGDRMLKAYGESLLATIPLGRAGTPEEVGKAAVFLASDDARFITGKILRVDGGAWM
jgi:3-oxoacyl-[acyl-carrier protein] reductase